jgi:hypothetical protein
MPACGYVGGAEPALKVFALLEVGGQELLSDIPTASEEDKLVHEIIQEFCQFGSIAVVVGRYGPNPGPSNGSGMGLKAVIFPLVTVAECAAVGTGLSVRLLPVASGRDVAVSYAERRDRCFPARQRASRSNGRYST